MSSKLELIKDVVQVAVESGAERVGRVVSLIAGTVKGVTHEVGEWASDIFEVIEAADKKANSAKPSRPRAGDRDA